MQQFKHKDFNEIVPEKGDLLRQIGKTTRIVNFILDQLFTTGEVIITDHVYFEYPNIGKKSCIYLIEKVKKLYSIQSHQDSKNITTKIIKLENIYLVHFKLKK